MGCNGLCDQYYAKRPLNGQRYIAGQKCCITCQIWIKYDGHHCPCCNFRLRTKPRGRKQRATYERQLVEARVA
jgi:hypothetical protein